ncbi:Aste57867_10680 [Aphanomyces stellatus]|uniref:Aste57867_10680 protein n=1 Tax=Aphanomyces stellatus TaxID=120398 RepID=A0A485KRL1_9STRA|nr:hypothetical protein As57867_010640 [Aphanomyces stellatus]VFT87552.1 Aste57867_10680 [Aphanomyces stellatus]
MNILATISAAAAFAVQVTAHGDPPCTAAQSAVIMAFVAQPIPATCLKVVKAANVSSATELAAFIGAYPTNATALLCSSVDCTTYLKTWASVPACEMTLGSVTLAPADSADHLLSDCPASAGSSASIASTTMPVTTTAATTAKPSTASVAVVGAATAVAMIAVMLH